MRFIIYTLVLFKKPSAVIMSDIFTKTYNVSLKKRTVISLNFAEIMGKSSFTHPLKHNSGRYLSMTVSETSETSRSEYVNDQYSSNRPV